LHCLSFSLSRNILNQGRPHTAGSFNTKRNRSLSTHRRSLSASETGDQLIDGCRSDPAFAESLREYYRYVLEKSQRPKLGLQQYHIKEPSNRLLKQSGIYRNSSLTKGQRLYLLEKCHVIEKMFFFNLIFQKFRFMMFKIHEHVIQILIYKF
jgi:hypothetical protein